MTGIRTRWPWLAILLIIGLAFSLRIYAIDRQDIWGDEAFSIWLSSQPLSEVVAGGADTHPPLYPFLLFLWLRLGGSSSFAVRFLSALIGTLTVPVVYGMGCRVLQSLRGYAPFYRRSGICPNAVCVSGGLLAALLVAVSPVMVYYSQETRMYGLVALLAAASMYWVMRAYQETRSFGVWLAYLLTTLGAAYTHYYAFFVIVAQNLIVGVYFPLRRRWADLGRWLGVQVLVALAYVPWVVVQSRFLSGKAGARFDEWNLSTALRIAGETLKSFGGGLAVSTTAGWLGLAVFVLATLAGLVLVWRSRKLEPWLVAAYLCVPLILAWAVNPIMPFFYARYLLLIAPAFYLLAALGALTLWDLWRPFGIAIAAILLVIGGHGLWGYYTDEAYAKGHYGAMMAHIESNAQPGDGILLANQLQRPIFEYYQPKGLDAYFFPRHGYALEDPRTVHDLEGIAARHPRLWLVRFGDPAEYDPDGYLSRWLATHGSKAYFDGWVDADLALYVMMPAAEGGDIPHPMSVDLGDRVRLLGYAVSSEQVAQGDSLLLTLYWQALSSMQERYTVFTHLLDGNEQIRAQVDSEPQGGGLPTDRWTTGLVVQDNYALTVTSDSQPGMYTLEVGMYLLQTLERLPVSEAGSGTPLGDRILLGTVEVIAP